MLTIGIDFILKSEQKLNNRHPKRKTPTPKMGDFTKHRKEKQTDLKTQKEKKATKQTTSQPPRGNND